MANSDFIKGMAFMGGLAVLAAGAYFAAKKYIEIRNDMAFECGCDCDECGYDECAGKTFSEDMDSCCCAAAEDNAEDIPGDSLE